MKTLDRKKRAAWIPAFAGMTMLGVATAHAAPNDYLIVPGARAGFLTAKADEALIKKTLKPSEYKKVPVSVEDFKWRCGMVLYPDTGAEMRITWKSDKHEYDMPVDDATRHCAKQKLSKPDFVELERLPDDERKSASPWKTQEGLKLGMTMQQVEKINGKPFRMTSGEPQAGVVTSWNGGKVSPLVRALLHSTFEGDPAEVESNDPRIAKEPYKLIRLQVRLGK